MTTYDNDEVMEWLRNEKAKRKEAIKAKREAIKLKYKGYKFIATPSGNTKILQIDGSKKSNILPIKKTSSIKTNKDNMIHDNTIKQNRIVTIDDKYSLITGDPEGESLIDEEGNVRDSFEYTQKATGNKYGNKTIHTKKRKGEATEDDFFNNNIENKEGEYTNENAEIIIQEIGKKIEEINLLFEKLKGIINLTY